MEAIGRGGMPCHDMRDSNLEAKSEWNDIEDEERTLSGLVPAFAIYTFSGEFPQKKLAIFVSSLKSPMATVGAVVEGQARCLAVQWWNSRENSDEDGEKPQIDSIPPVFRRTMLFTQRWKRREMVVVMARKRRTKRPCDRIASFFRTSAFLHLVSSRH